MSDRDRMHGSTVLVTGGTGGIGLATATGLAGLGARVGIVGRSAARGAAAADGVRRLVPSAQVDVFEADLSAQAEVRRLAAEVKDAYPRLDVLVNNVGGYWAHRHVTADGLEHTFALNHLAPFLLTHELRDLLVASAPARVVTVSSGAQAMGRIDLDDLQGERSYNGQRAYNQSKLANVLFTYELARRLEGTGVTATVLHPGVVRTAFGREDAAGCMRLMFPLVTPFMKTPEQGAATSIYLASSPEVAGVTGAYFANRQPEAVLEGQLRPRPGPQALGGQRRADRRDRGGPMRLGVHLVDFGTPDGPAGISAMLAGLGPAAEEAGVDNLSLMDHYLQMGMLGGDHDPMLEGYTTLGFLAAHTRRVELQLLMTGVTYRHPGLLAKIVATLDVLSGGRAALGIGAAWYEREHLAYGVPFPAAQGAVRATRGDPAHRPADVERRRRTLRGHALPARRDHLRTAAAPPDPRDGRRQR